MAEPGQSSIQRKAALSVDILATICRAEDLPLASTEEIPDLETILGQQRALQAIQFGLGTERHGYNRFVLGSSGIGKHSAVMRLLSERAAQGEVLPDLCYVANYEEPAKLRLLQLPAGRGAELRRDMQHFVEELVGALPAALESNEFKARLRQIEQAFEQRQIEAIRALHEKSEPRR